MTVQSIRKPCRARHSVASAGCVLMAYLLGSPVVSSGASTAHAQSEGKQGDGEEGDARYRELIASAVAEFELGQWQEAIALFREAHRLRPSPKTHRGLGQALFEARDYVQAIPHLRAALAADSGTFEPEQRTILERTLYQARGFVGDVYVEVRPRKARVSIDGKAVSATADALSLNPGEHTIVVRAGDHLPFQQRFVVEGGKPQTLRIQLVPDSPSPGDPGTAADDTGASPVIEATVQADSGDGVPWRTLGFVSAGLATASFATAFVLWRVHEDGPVEDWARGDCKTIPTLTAECQGARDEASDLETAIAVSAIAGGVLTAAAITFFALPAEDERETQAAFRCGIGPGALLCNGAF